MTRRWTRLVHTTLSQEAMAQVEALRIRTRVSQNKALRSLLRDGLDTDIVLTTKSAPGGAGVGFYVEPDMGKEVDRFAANNAVWPAEALRRLLDRGLAAQAEASAAQSDGTESSQQPPLESGEMDLSTFKYQRVTGELRQELSDYVYAGYLDGKSIRGLAEETGRSYGSILLLVAERTELRGRGGQAKEKPESEQKAKRTRRR